MDHEVEARAERVRHHRRRPLVGTRNLLMKAAGNALPVTDPTLVRYVSHASKGCGRGRGDRTLSFVAQLAVEVPDVMSRGRGGRRDNCETDRAGMPSHGRSQGSESPSST